MEKIYDQREDLLAAKESLKHFPAKPDKFEFDADVAMIFPDMARRSIPDYERFHALHTELVRRWYAKDGARMVDLGASHGEFFQNLLRGYFADNLHIPDMQLIAVDEAEGMCNIMRRTLPTVTVLRETLTDAALYDTLLKGGQFDVVNATYVLQFIPVGQQAQVLANIADLVKPGGILILGQKDLQIGPLGGMLHELYIGWRMGNGYTRASIDAKSRALQNSMWPLEFDELMDMLNHTFRDVVPTTRSYMFNTLIAYK